MHINNFEKASKSEYAQNKKLLSRLRQTKPKKLDSMFEGFHDDAFEKIDCLSCANCCKTTSPIFIQADIDRLAKVFRMKSSEFIDTYLHLDADQDYVLNIAPCPFLNDDNTCFVYEERPKACREYPHTNRKNMHGILNLTLRNSLVCPAVHEIFQEIGKVFRK